MKLVLYYSPISCALVPYIALTEANANFEVQVVNFKRGEHLGEDFRRINPKHQVPVLAINNDPLTENMAILLWIARNYPHAQLLPVDGLDEFKAIALMAWCDAGIHPHLTPNLLPERYCDMPGSEEGVRRAAQKLLHEKFQLAESLLADTDWFFRRFTLADAFFFWCFRRAMQFDLDIGRFANCRAHFDRVSQRASVQKLIDFESMTVQAMQSRA